MNGRHRAPASWRVQLGRRIAYELLAVVLLAVALAVFG